MLYYEDLDPGDHFDCGTAVVDRDAAVGFARRYDPRPGHLGEDPVASGWHVAALTMRRLVEGVFADAATMAGVGIDDLRWHATVRPGDALHVGLSVCDREPWDERRGVVRCRVTVTATPADEPSDGAGRRVLSMDALVLFARRAD